MQSKRQNGHSSGIPHRRSYKKKCLLQQFNFFVVSFTAKIKFISNKRRSEGPKIFSEYIKRPPKSYAYSSAIFSGEADWLKASGPKIEQRLAILRQQAAIVSGIRESLFRLSRLTYAYHELLRQDQLPQSNDDLAFLDALMGADVDEAQKASPTSDSPANWISTSEKCQKWMKERQTFALNSTA